jgi:HK97 family phage major capsid protein
MGNNLSENGRWILLGKEVFISDQMPTLAAGAKAIYYGDLSGLYVKMTQEVQVQVLQEKYADEYAVGVAAFCELDAVVVEPQKLAVYIGL